MNRADADRSGFTLLEIMISIAILSIVIVIVYGVFARTLTAKEYAEARSAETGTARAILNRIVRDLATTVMRASSALPQPTPSQDRDEALPKAVQQILFRSQNVVDGGVPFDDLAFSAIVRRPSASGVSSSDLAVIRYFVERDPANPQRHALFRETVFSLSGQVFDPEEPDPAGTVRLLDGVAGLEFRFYNGREWIQEWDSGDARNYGPAPLAVEIALAVWNAAGEPELFHTAIDLPVARPSGAAPGQGAQAGATPTPTD
ncbi:MAG: type II secretion system protein GspJ [Candidatus Binatia bacterium]